MNKRFKQKTHTNTHMSHEYTNPSDEGTEKLRKRVNYWAGYTAVSRHPIQDCLFTHHAVWTSVWFFSHSRTCRYMTII